MSTLEDAIQYIRMGDKEEGRQILEEILEVEENNEEVWLWLTAVVDSNEDREICLENVLALDPNHQLAQQGLEDVRADTFDPNEFVSQALEAEEQLDEEDLEISSTFLDDFVLDDFEEEDDSFEGKSSSKKSKKKSGGLNVRFLILGGLAVVLVLVVTAAVGAYFFLAGGDGTTPAGSPATQETPAQGQEAEPTATPTETPTPTPAPTDTPTITPTSSLLLPTPKPTNPPTPTATRVVSPTPVN